jgi:hypothetical protein
MGYIEVIYSVDLELCIRFFFGSPTFGNIFLFLGKCNSPN